MSESTERVASVCPSCSPAESVAHEVLSRGGQATIRCSTCGHVHKTRLESPPTVERRVVVSQGGESFETKVDAPADETVAVGEEFLVETDEAVLSVRITSLELADQQRADEASVAAVQTFWTRAVGNLAVNVTLHPPPGSEETTRSIRIHVPGDETFVVGETMEFGEDAFSVEGIQVREDATGYGHSRLDHPGDSVVAKDVQRLYARDETSSAWSAW